MRKEERDNTIAEMSQKDHITFTRIRPRISVDSVLTPKVLTQQFRDHLTENEDHVHGDIVHGYVTITPPHSEQHFWSPQLTMTIEETEEGSHLRGLYGPQPKVWTMFVFFYAMIGFAFAVTGMIGLSFWQIDKPFGFWWLLPVLGVLFISLYATAYAGQKLGHKQMTRLHRFTEEVLKQNISTL